MHLNPKSQPLAEITLKPNCIVPFFSDGNWNLYQLLSHCLSFTGKASVKMSSFSLSENAIRSFINDKQSGRIDCISMLFDISIPKRKFDLMLFAHEVVSEIRLAPNHSKVVIIEGEHLNATIITSHNLTPNPRIEAGCIFTTHKHFNFYNRTFDYYFAKAIPFNPLKDE